YAHHRAPAVACSVSVYGSPYHQHLHSLPTRRSSDLECPVPALFQTLELSFPGLSSCSNTVMSISGATSFKIVPKVALITPAPIRSEEHTSELQSRFDLVCRLLLEKKKIYPLARRGVR